MGLDSVDLAEAPTVTAPDDARPSPYAWYVASVLMLAYVMSMVDRKFPFILVEAIKKDLSLSDTQIGLLSGMMFTLIYATLAIPVARIADKGSRKGILGVSLLVWSGLTAAGGFATNFWQLAGARIGVAVGEASCSPAAHSMISDYFSPKYRSRALGFYFMGAYLGVLIGLAAGGWINDMANWRVAMFVLGIPGVLLALLMMLTVREPERRVAKVASPGEAPSLATTLKMIFGQPPLVIVLAAEVLISFTFGGVQAFAPAYLMRTFALTSSQVGWSYGLCVGVAGVLGSLLGGFVGDRFSQRPWKSLATVALCLAVCAPALALALLSANYLGFLAFFFVAQLGMMIQAGPSFAFMHSRLNPRMYAVGSAVLLFAQSGIGISFGPLAAGLLSDAMKAAGAANPLRTALLIVLVPAAVSSALYLVGALLARRRKGAGE
ncbi:MAG: transporter [Phenylobacterium sp.]|nr:transporter [Phenylobacterium sp.]